MGQVQIGIRAMQDDIKASKSASRGQSAREIMDTPQKALNVARMASWTSIALAAGLALALLRFIGARGASAIITRPAIATELVAAVVVGGIAYFRPTSWSISLTLVLLAWDAVDHLFGRGFDMALVIDGVFAVMAMMSFQGARRYAELRQDDTIHTVFD